MQPEGADDTAQKDREQHENIASQVVLIRYMSLLSVVGKWDLLKQFSGDETVDEVFLENLR